MIKLELNKMQKAIARAKTVRPRVTVINAADRTYKVTGSKGSLYTVKFVVVNGHKLGECDCPAGRLSQMCYHIPAAAAVNIALHTNYSKPSETPKALASEVKKNTMQTITEQNEKMMKAENAALKNAAEIIHSDERVRVVPSANGLCYVRVSGWRSAKMNRARATQLKERIERRMSAL